MDSIREDSINCEQMACVHPLGERCPLRDSVAIGVMELEECLRRSLKEVGRIRLAWSMGK